MVNSPGGRCPIYYRKSGEITPERLKRCSQNENNAQLWMRQVMEVKSETVKSNVAYEPGMLGP